MPLLWAEFPIQFLVPAIFLVIWVVNQVLARNQGPPAGRRNPMPGRAGGMPTREGPNPPRPTRASQAPARAPNPSARPRSAEPPPSNRPAASPASRAGRRAPPPPRRAPTAPARARESAPPPDRAERRPRHQPRPDTTRDELYAIYEVGAGAPRPSIRDGVAPSAAPPAARRRPLLADLSRERLRDAVLLAEILRPPVVLRNRGPRR